MGQSEIHKRYAFRQDIRILQKVSKIANFYLRVASAHDRAPVNLRSNTAAITALSEYVDILSRLLDSDRAAANTLVGKTGVSLVEAKKALDSALRCREEFLEGTRNPYDREAYAAVVHQMGKDKDRAEKSRKFLSGRYRQR